ncbi:MAG: 3-hydroxyacyl-CoA dehydrogenase family protein [Gemmatimonadota bacterium]
MTDDAAATPRDAAGLAGDPDRCPATDDLPDDAAAPEGPVAVLGAGTMGHGIAQIMAMAGHPVRLQDVDPVALEDAVERIRDNLDQGVELEKVSASTRDGALSRLTTFATAGEAAEGAAVVIEAVPERLELKREVLAEAAAHAADDALLASNTSSLSIGDIASGMDARDRVVGTHFFNPVHIMDLVEVVRGDDSDPRQVARAVALAREADKTPIVVCDSPGFASSRLGVALGLEAIRMLEEGVASARDIDRAMELGYNHPMGPLRLTDLVGLDTRLEIARYLDRELDGDRFEPPDLLVEMVEAGDLGKKTGQGFYQW